MKEKKAVKNSRVSNFNTKRCKITLQKKYENETKNVIQKNEQKNETKNVIHNKEQPHLIRSEKSASIDIIPFKSSILPYLLNFYRLQLSDLAMLFKMETHCLLFFSDWFVCEILIEFLKNTKEKMNKRTLKNKRSNFTVEDYMVCLEPTVLQEYLNEKLDTNLFDGLWKHNKINFQQLPSDTSTIYTLLSKPFTIFYTTRPDVIETMEKRNRSRYNGREILFGNLNEGSSLKLNELEKMDSENNNNKILGERLNHSNTESNMKIHNDTVQNNDLHLPSIDNIGKTSLFLYYSSMFHKKYNLECDYFNIFKNIHLAVLMAVIRIETKMYNHNQNGVSPLNYSQKKQAILEILICIPELTRADRSLLINCIDDLRLLLLRNDWHRFAIKEVKKRNVQWLWRIIK